MSENAVENEQQVVQTDIGAKDGQVKCPKCGATEISLNTKTGMLRCEFCRHEFKPEKVEGLDGHTDELEGEFIGSGAKDITAEAANDNVKTFKCSSCGAEVVIDTSESTQARCHWCRNVLSINQQIENGAVPDVVLPFNSTREEAKKQIETFVGRRKFFAHPNFRREFTTDNVMGVYFPYMVVDINSHVSLAGEGEHEVRRYSGGKDDKTTYYDADLYAVEREFDLTIDGLTVESNSDRRQRTSEKTNNIINSIMPFDIENCVKYDSNYLRGYTSEKRDTNIDELKPLVQTQAKDVARISANSTIKFYDRGVKWNTEDMQIKGSRWKTAYLPVWLYSYLQKKGDGSGVLHYVASNARTRETMGSVPIHFPKLFLFSLLVELIAFILFLLVILISDELEEVRYLLLLAGFIFYGIKYSKYRNKKARHFHESETPHKMSNLREADTFIKHRKGLTNSSMNGANNNKIYG